MERVRELIDTQLAGHLEFVAHSVVDNDFGDPLFKRYALRDVHGVKVAVIGQAFPGTPIANPRHLAAAWRFGIQEEQLQAKIDAARAAGARIVALLSPYGMDVDVKLAGRMRGLDAILGGHTHDGVLAPVLVENAGGRTLVTDAGSNTTFLGVLALDVADSGLRDWRYRLLPMFAILLPADAPMQAEINAIRTPHAAQLAEPLAVSEGLLYRRSNFNGSFDQVILDALLAT
jgi:sulfur-oxidizing protein SoxB